MGNCATKPKVLKDSDEDRIPVDQETTAPSDHTKDTAEKSQNNAAEEAATAEAVAARRSEKGKEILIEDDVEEHNNRQSLSHLFHENKAIEKDITDLSPTNSEINNKTGSSSEVSKLDTSAVTVTKDKAPEAFNVQTRNDVEVKIPKDSEVKTPETPKAKEFEEQEVSFSDDWEVKFPEELEANKTSEVVKVADDSKHTEVSESFSPELPEIKVIKESDVPEVLEDKDTSNVKSDKVKVAESELLKVSEVKSSEDLKIEVPKMFEVKTSETSNVKNTDESEVESDQETTKDEIAEETKVLKFIDAQEKLDKPEAQIFYEDIKVTEDKEEENLSFEKKVKETTQ